MAGDNDLTDTLKVHLTNRVDTRERVVFKVTPEISETRSVTYSTLDPIHTPGSFRVFKNTSNRIFQLTSIKLISRTTNEAAENQKMLNILRSWAMPYFGTGTRRNIRSLGQGAALGMPPPILLLSAYSSAQYKGNIYRIPIIIENINFTYPSDVDYITQFDGDPFPTLMSVDLQAAEVHSPQQFKQFDLLSYKTGKLEGF